MADEPTRTPNDTVKVTLEPPTAGAIAVAASLRGLTRPEYIRQATLAALARDRVDPLTIAAVQSASQSALGVVAAVRAGAVSRPGLNVAAAIARHPGTAAVAELNRQIAAAGRPAREFADALQRRSTTQTEQLDPKESA